MVELSANFIEARKRLSAADRLLSSFDYVTSLGKTQEAIELTVKETLDCFGAQYPREHDVSHILPGAYKMMKDHLGDQEKKELKRCFAQIAILSKVLGRIRNDLDYPIFDVAPSEVFSYPLSGVAKELLSMSRALHSMIESKLNKVLKPIPMVKSIVPIRQKL